MCQHREVSNKDDAGHWCFGIASDLSTREAQNITHATALVYDFDPKQHADYEALTDILLLFGYRWWAHSTFSHTEEAPAFRIILPVDTAIPADQYKEAWRAVEALLRLFGDPTACSIQRSYYLPSCKPGAPRFAEQGLGPCVPWQAILQTWIADKPKPSAVPVKSYDFRGGGDDVRRLALLKALQIILDGTSPDCGMAEWLHIVLAAADALGHEGIEIVDKWSQGSDKYKPREMLNIRRRSGL